MESGASVSLARLSFVLFFPELPGHVRKAGLASQTPALPKKRTPQILGRSSISLPPAGSFLVFSSLGCWLRMCWLFPLYSGCIHAD